MMLRAPDKNKITPMKIYGLIGFPLGHSFSKKYFTEKFQKEQLQNCSFELFPIDDISKLPSLIAAQPDLHGLAVTIPYKQSVIPYLNEVSDEVKKIKAVNCISFEQGKLKGYNTDVTGFEQSFVPYLLPHHQRALILGSGGAAKAVMYVLDKLGIAFMVVSRTPQPGGITYNDLTVEVMDQHSIIINCSPVGMTPADDEKPDIPYDALDEGNYCYDLIYTPAETGFLAEARKRGAIVKNGMDMLTIQAEENWKIWNQA
jgi:shikimate dehydrogenase